MRAHAPPTVVVPISISNLDNEKPRPGEKSGRGILGDQLKPRGVKFLIFAPNQRGAESGSGQTAKNSPQAYVFRLAPELGYCSTRSALHTKKKGRLRCHKRPKSREETPKEGSDSGMGLGVATA
jgi:hypothetical protein